MSKRQSEWSDQTVKPIRWVVSSSDCTEPNRVKPSQTEPNRIKPNQTESNRIKPSQTDSNRIK